MLSGRHCCCAQLLDRSGRLLRTAALSCAAELPQQLRKDLLDALQLPQFGPQTVEPVQRLWQHCQQQDATTAKSDSATDQLLLLPPPNVTGRLHMGHALAFVIQDVLLRAASVRGETTRWLPGFDHAGIATQVLVERRLASELGVTRHQIGREAFVLRAQRWAGEMRQQIRDQLKQLGLSLDWSEEFYTLDQHHCEAVTEAFVRLHEAGLLYRDEQLVNWSCSLQSAISDIEVEWRQLSGRCQVQVPGHEAAVEFGLLHELEYPLEDSGQQQQQQQQQQSVRVATTRPETALGDTGVAVHPADGRWSSLIGRRARHPITGRLLPIVADTEVDAAFGTGAVKVTPAHSRQDLRLAERHGLERRSVFGDDGRVLPEFGDEYAGLPRFQARELLLRHLRHLRLYRGAVHHQMTLPICSRSGDVVEQLLRPQWFLRCSPQLTQPAAEAVAGGRLKILPPGFAGEWQEWMSRTGDWCLSRQIWWGHRIPAYQALDSSGSSLGWVVSRSPEAARQSAASRWGGAVQQLRQDADVLDTWFSSGLLPLSLAGWPGQLRPGRFPLTLLETGHDILFFWVARMVMLSQQLLQGRLPFGTVLLNGLICDAAGRKMSKSSGNVLDPLTLMQAGPDPLRLALCCHRFQLEQVSFDQQWVSASARFLNKLWQSHRLLRRHFDEQRLTGSDFGELLNDLRRHADERELDKVDAWLLSRAAALAADCQRATAQLQLQDTANRLKQFWTADFCDVFLECLKISARPAVSAKVAFVCSGLLLQQLYPYCPHTAELLWRGLRPDCRRLADAETIAGCRLGDWRDAGAEHVFGFVLQLLRRLQDWRQLLRPHAHAEWQVLYSSARCPIDAGQYSRLFERLGRAPLVASSLSTPPAADSQLLRLQLCEGLQLAARRSSLRVDAAQTELRRRLQRQEMRQRRLLHLGDRISESQRRKLQESQEQAEQLRSRIAELED